MTDKERIAQLEAEVVRLRNSLTKAADDFARLRQSHSGTETRGFLLEMMERDARTTLEDKEATR